MNGNTDNNGSVDHIARRAERLAHMRNKKSASPLHGLSAFGVIGWSVAVPTVSGALLGGWLNQVAPQTFSWTLALILGGLVLGVGFAWNWISEAQQKAQDDSLPAADAPEQNNHDA